MNPIEMANGSHQGVVIRLSKIEGYRKLVTKAFNCDEITIDHVARAIAAYERTGVSGDSAFDRYQAGDKAALNRSQIRGMDLFFGRANCDGCHTAPLFTDEAFHRIVDSKDPGRSAVTAKAEDLGKFKTPSLRDLASTGPYMHNGALATIEDVVALYAELGEKVDPISDIGTFVLSSQDKKNLAAFLRSLSGEGWRAQGVPKEFPQ